MAESASDVPADKDTQMAILAQRRCIIIAIVGATPSSNSSLGLILQTGFLSKIKSWLDDILAGKVGESYVAFLHAECSSPFSNCSFLSICRRRR